ncbi:MULTISPECIES: ABC-three component system middle component 1 [unclassified Pseudomonas]|uniref:ABC-three component system middle component 1 n=1 Tax=unclassified Pseudomonas TaxID=196821 RepID=UPI001CBBD280|nr:MULTISPECIES: ABC-three component system middle component 1 [unclassified Pseudomonas]
MLINLIEKVFLSNGYETVNFEHGYDELITSLFKPKVTENKAEYYLVVECKNATIQHAEELLTKWADDLHLKVRESPKVDRVFSKNCTMIICWPEHALTRKQVFQLEEDRYNFKKNVISYSSEELLDLQEKNSSFTLLQLNELVGQGDGAYFQRFKEKSAELENYYSLLLKIFIKIPFLIYLHDPKRLFDLNSSLVTNLSESELALYEFTLGIDEGVDDEKLMSEFLKRVI